MAVTVRRFNRQERFTTISNEFLRANIPLSAFRVGCYLMTHTEAWRMTHKSIGAAVGLNESTVGEALRKLDEIGYLIRNEVRNERGHRVGTELLISDMPFDADERASLTRKIRVGDDDQPDPSGKGQGGEVPTGDSGGHKKTKPPKGTNTGEKTNPPGGDADAPAPEPAKDGGLFEAPDEPTAERVEAPPVQRVVASYVDAFRAKAQGRDPLRQDLAKVAGTAKRMVADPGVDIPQLIAAAKRLAATPFTDLAGEYRRMMTGATRPGAVTPDVNDPRSVIYTGTDSWARSAEETRRAKAEHDAAVARGEIEPDPTYF